jgi:membrane protease YdiL (CAAX protease family)
MAAAAFMMTQTAVAMVFVIASVVSEAQQDPEAIALRLKENGLLLSLASLAANPAALAICAAAVAVRRYPVLEYFAVKPFSRGDLALGVGCLAIYILLSDGLTHLSGRPIVPDFMVAVWQTAGFMPLLWLALMAAAPLGEELFFRGFVYRGWAESRLGPAGAIVLVSLLWAVIHVQYDWFGMSHIFAGGLLLGWLRYRSGSALLTILLHSLQNLVATLECAVKVELLS